MDTDTPDPALPPPSTPMADAVRYLICQAVGRSTLRDIDEEERLHMAANLLAFVRGWIGAAGAGVTKADAAAALEQISAILAPPPSPDE